jgi:hypothetical protein
MTLFSLSQMKMVPLGRLAMPAGLRNRAEAPAPLTNPIEVLPASTLALPEKRTCLKKFPPFISMANSALAVLVNPITL